LSVFRNNNPEKKTMPVISIYGIALLIILGLMIILWLVSLALKNSSIVDIFWGTGFIISGWVSGPAPFTNSSPCRPAGATG
jgi:steroid 5-alpha reductase family enzyme